MNEDKKHSKKNSIVSYPNASMKKEDKMTRKEFRTHKYQNALEKFNEFKKEREMLRKNTPITKFRKSSAKRKNIKNNLQKMQKPKSLAMMRTQPLNNNYIDFKNTQDLTKLIPDRHSAMSLQIGGGTYSQYKNKTNSRITQKAKSRAGSSQGFAGSKNFENNINYANYQKIYSNVGQPIRAIQRKHHKSMGKKIPSMGEHSQGRKEVKRPPSNKRKSYSNKPKRPISPKAGAFYGKIMGVERPKFVNNSKHHKIASATHGFEFYNAEKVYNDTKQIKVTQNKKVNSKKGSRIRSASPAVLNPNVVNEKKFYIPGVVPTHGIGVTGNKIKISKGDVMHKIIPGSVNHKKKMRNKSLSKTAQYKNPLRGLQY